MNNTKIMNACNICADFFFDFAANSLFEIFTRAEDAVDDAVRTVVRNVVASRRGSTEAVSVTPPQGWHPVQVPAPTYTLVASAPKRAIEELDDETGPSAPVPARPTSARPSVPAEVGETLRPPIDLDAVLQRRRAAGA